MIIRISTKKRGNITIFNRLKRVFSESSLNIERKLNLEKSYIKEQTKKIKTTNRN